MIFIGTSSGTRVRTHVCADNILAQAPRQTMKTCGKLRSAHVSLVEHVAVLLSEQHFLHFAGSPQRQRIQENNLVRHAQACN